MQNFTSSSLERTVHGHMFSNPGFLVLCVLLFSLVFCGQAMAMHWDLGKDVTLDVDVTTTYGLSARVADQDDDLLSDINADDGNRNFDQGDLINNKFTLIADIDLKRENIGFFLRPKAFYDFAYKDGNANDSPATNNNGPANGGPLKDNTDFTEETKDRHRDDAEILDAFAYSTFDIGGGRLLDIRVGQQVVSWGESFFLQNGVSSAQGPLDVTATNAPGVELEEVYLPVGQVHALMDLGWNFTIGGYYQWEWEKSRLDEAGSYFSTNDFLDEAGYRILLQEGLDAAIDRGQDEEPDDDGQYGLSLRYFAENLNGTEFGLHFINYHEKIPMVKFQPGGGTLSATAQALGGDWGNLPVGPGTTLGMVDPVAAATLNAQDRTAYFLDYAEDVKLYGFSVGTNFGDQNFGCDITLRQDYPVQMSDGSYEEIDVFQAQANFVHALGRGPMSLWDTWTLIWELGYARALDKDDDELAADQYAWGGSAKLSLNYYYILPNLDLTPSLAYRFNPDGTSVNGTFSENDDSLGFGLEFTYKTKYEFGFEYVAYLGDPEDNEKTDRDFVGFYAKYTF